MKFLIALLAALPLHLLAATASLSTGASCAYDLVTITPGGGIAVTCSGSAPPPPPPPNPPAPPPPAPPQGGCNAGSIQPPLAWGEVRQQRAASGQVMAFPIASPQSWHVSVQFTQGQQPSTAAGTITEYTVSRCPGAIDSSAGVCYYRGPFVNNNGMDIYARDNGAGGCVASPMSGQWYINVRWTYATCPFGGGCGFSLQWADGPW